MSKPGKPPSRAAARPAAPPRARLASELPERLQIGRGNCLVLEGHCSVPRSRGGEVRLSLGERRARLLSWDVPPPGERAGGGWWIALVEIAELAAAETAPISLTVSEPSGSRNEFGLGALVLDPGEQGPGTGSAADHVAICLATHEPPIELLRTQIESIRAQTHERWNCVISDDASSPARLREIEALVGGDDRFRLRSGERRLGFYRNFERSIAAAPPEAGLIALADQDDRWHPDKLSALIAGLGEADLVHSDARVVDEAGRLLAPGLWPGRRPGETLPEVLFANPVTGASCLFRRELLPFALPFPALAGTAYHDRWLALVAAAHGSIAHVDRPLYDYVQHADAALGHGGLAGIGPDASRWAAMRRRAGALAAGELRPDWRTAHDVLLCSLGEAAALRLRLGEQLDPSQRAALAEVEGLAGSARSRARLGLRAARRALAGRPGIEPALLRGTAWPALARTREALARARDRASAARGARGGGAATAQRFGITVSDTDEAAGFGDLHVARGLAEALRAEGREVTLLSLADGSWRRRLGSLDVVVSLLDAFPCDAVPEGVVRIAWVRNWTERWIERSWFERYELAFASSEASAGLIEERTGVPAQALPLATDPQTFHPLPPDPDLACDLLFAGNHWGGERRIAAILPQLAERFRVRVFGRGWESVPEMDRLSEGPIAYARLPAAYCSAALVVDDSAAHAAPYGAVNSRVFDALACGAAVATNDAQGVPALFGEDFPVFSDAESLASLAAQAVESPKAAASRTEALRQQVLDRHTYAQRARRLITEVESRASQR